MTKPKTKVRVLIVDHNATTRENIEKLLFFTNDIEVVGLAATTQETLTQVTHYEPHVIVLDTAVPQAEWRTIIDEIGEIAPRSQIVLTSVAGAVHYFATPLPQQVQALLIKPINTEALVRAIRHAAR